MKYPTLAARGFKIYSSTLPKRASMGGLVNAGFEGAAAGRRLGVWSVGATGPNSANASTLTTLRARCRDAIRNNPWAYSALESWATNLVGRGIRPKWQVEDEALRKEIHQAWDDWTKESDADGMNDFYGQQSLAAKTIIHSGAVLGRMRSRRLSDGLTVPLQVQLLEPDFLDESKDGLGPNGATYHMGVELNAIGSRSAYWLRKQHPGDNYWTPGSLDSSPVPAAQIAHCYRVDRPGQMHGIPWLSVVLARLFLLDQYEDAELDRKKTAALFAGFITKNGDLAGPGGVVGFNQDENRDDLDRPFAELEPGMLNYLLPGEEVSFAAPADVGGNYEPWIKMNLRAIAASIGITYEQLTGDMTGINFSAARARIIEFRRQARQVIGSVLNFQFNQKVARWFMGMAVASGRLKIPDYAENPAKYLRIEWRPDAWEWVQPREDLETAKGMVRAGFKTREDVVTEVGGDIEEIDRRTAERNKKVDELDLVYDSDPRKVSNAGLTQARTAGSEIPPDVDEKRDQPNGDGKGEQSEDDEQNDQSQSPFQKARR